MKNQPIFFTSDWHIGHSAVLTETFDNRPFSNLDEMHDKLIKNFNNLVPKNGITYFLGDIGLSNLELIKGIITQLNGVKILILGNHDKKSQAMTKYGFDLVVYGIKLVIQGKVVTLSHCPLYKVYRENTEGMRGTDGTENWHGETKHYPKFSFIDEGQFHLHGHIHSPNKGKSKKILGKQFDVGVVANNYKPVSISAIESWIVKYGR